jgi:acetyltransferase-like isoleucine patch superfamily enzyme
MGIKSFAIKLLAKLVYKIVHHPAYRNIEKEKFGFKSISGSYFIQDPCYIKNPHYISIGRNFSSLNNLRLEAIDDYAGVKFTPELVIGNDVSITADCHMGCINKIVIGNNVLIASKVFISDHSHGEVDKQIKNVPPAKRKLFSKGPVIIEDNVWIGEGVSILSGVTIGKNSIVGANAVVTKSLPANSIAGGIPAKVLKSF